MKTNERISGNKNYSQSAKKYEKNCIATYDVNVDVYGSLWNIR